ncbi:unannotated protein [freshwater metagenome]|uniref:Unannotated protein n=1 Tax=freshwater metagenome TaxID=449393 RepID=A0A6J7CYK9_9ZZZZ
MTDLAALGRTDAAGLAVRPRGHVVVVHVALLLLWRERVEQLVHARHGECGDVEHLGLAALEQARAVRRVEDTDLGRDRTEVRGTTAVDANTFLHHALADELLGEAANGFLDLLLAAGELARCILRTGQRGNSLGRSGVSSGIALGLERDGDRLGDLVADHTADAGADVVAVVENRLVGQRRDRTLRSNDCCNELLLQRYRFLDPALRGLETAGDDLFGHLRCAVLVVRVRLLRTTCLHHHDGDVAVVQFAARDDEFECRVVTLLERGVRDPLARLAVGQTHGADGAVERDAADHERRGCGVDGQDVVRVRLIGTEYRDDHLGLVAVAIGEGRAQRTVSEAAGEDCVLSGTTLTAEERAGDLARGICTLFDVDRQREEIDAVTDVFCGVCSRKHRGAPDGGHHSPLGLQSQLAGLVRQGLVGAPNGTRHADGVSHSMLLYVFGGAPRFPVGKPPRSP